MKTNFCPGPSLLPNYVIERLQQMIVNYKNTGVSLLSISHRDKIFDQVHTSIQTKLRNLLKIPDNYSVLLMHGGATSQFSAVPMNLKDKHNKALYISSGQWSEKAAKEAKKFINVDSTIYNKDMLNEYFLSQYDYIHYTDNETIDGIEDSKFIKKNNDIALVSDMSSNFLSKPLDIKNYGLIYSGAQKNAGIPGVTIVIVKDSLIQEKSNIPVVFDYSVAKKSNSVYSTPSVISWVAFELTLEYLTNEFGNLAEVEKFNKSKAKLLYSTIDNSKLYKNNVNPKHRSNMNVIFHLASEELTEKFLLQADKQGFYGLKGHRSVGGCRASLYNAVSLDDVNKLVKFMRDFENEQL